MNKAPFVAVTVDEPADLSDAAHLEPPLRHVTDTGDRRV